MTRGRPPKYTPERTQAILDSIAARVPYQIAAEANGICEETLYDWLRDGLRDQKLGIKSELASFSESLKKIEENRIKEHLENINTSPERWQAQAWILERRWWQHFSPNGALREVSKKIDKIKEHHDTKALEKELEEAKPNV